MIDALIRRVPAIVGALFTTACAADGASLPDESVGGSTSNGASGSESPAGTTGGSAPSAGETTSSGGSVTTSTGSTSGAHGSPSPSSTASNGGSLAGTGGTSPSEGTVACTATGRSESTAVGGYVTADPWHGYPWTAKGGTGTTISPDDFSMSSAGSALCACGTVKGTTDYSGIAMIGINLNQETTGNELGTVIPSGSGVTVAVTGAGTIPLRLQIQGPAGETDASQRWCADLPAGGGTIAWTDFQFECWETGARAPFDGTSEIVAAIVLVPGTTTDIPFDFCVTGLSNAP